MTQSKRRQLTYGKHGVRSSNLSRAADFNNLRIADTSLHDTSDLREMPRILSANRELFADNLDQYEVPNSPSRDSSIRVKRQSATHHQTTSALFDVPGSESESEILRRRPVTSKLVSTASRVSPREDHTLHASYQSRQTTRDKRRTKFGVGKSYLHSDSRKQVSKPEPVPLGAKSSAIVAEKRDFKRRQEGLDVTAPVQEETRSKKRKLKRFHDRESSTTAPTSFCNNSAARLGHRDTTPISDHEPVPEIPAPGISSDEEMGSVSISCSSCKNAAASTNLVMSGEGDIPEATATPRQASMWRGLLESENGALPATGMRNLSLNPTNPPDNFRGVRRKLVDALKQDHKPDIEQESESDETSDSDGEASSMSLTASDVFQPQDNEHDPEAKLPSQTHMPPGAALLNAPKVTYASQRSFLDDSVDEIGVLMSQPIVSPLAPNLRGVPERLTDDFALPDDDLQEENVMKNLYELRALGGNMRFRDDVKNILDELQATGRSHLTRKRSALFELTRRLSSDAFRERVIQEEFDRQIVAACRIETDVLCSTLTAAACFSLLGAHGQHSSASHLRDGGIFQILDSLMQRGEDIGQLVRERSLNVSKASQRAFNDLKSSLLSQPDFAWVRSATLSPRKLAMKVAEMLVMKLRDSGDGAGHLTPDILDQALFMLTERNITENAVPLSLLEAATLSSECSMDNSLWTERRVETFADHCEGMLAKEMSSNNQSLLLRTILNLSNSSASRSDRLSSGGLPARITRMIRDGFEALGASTESHEGLEAYDGLVLALGVVMNLCEMSTICLKKLADSKDRTDDIRWLVTAFSKGRRRASEAESLVQSQANVAYGYLAVLLGTLCQDATMRQVIQLTLPDRRLTSLANAVEEFVLFHKAADRKDGNDVWISFTERLQAISAGLRNWC